MVRGGKVSGKRNFRKRARSKEGGSDESDEDYVVSDEDRYVSDCPDDYSSSLDGCASEESFDGDGFIEDEEEEEKIQPVRKFNRSKAKNGVCGRRKNASKTSRKRGRITNVKQEEQERDADREEDEDGDKDRDKDEDFNYDDDDDEEEFTPEEEDYSDDEEDFDYDDDGDGDEEFTPKEEDCTDDEEGTRVRKKKKNGMKMGKKVLKRRVSVTSTRRRNRRSSRASKKPLRKKRRKNGGLKRKVRSIDADDFIDNCPAIRKKRTKKLGQENSRLLVKESNSDCVSSDYEFTISEEEREQVREAKELCPSLRRNLRSSSLVMKDEESGVHEDLHWQRRPPGRKGKEKIEEPQGKKGKEKAEELKSEVGKQLCGICLSEETKRRVRGVLDCCTHYFCFSCIMEWAKVESRCPLCKQRFKSISKPARSSAGIDLREVVVQVPERDQVYQPSEEELRSYIDPYESVICSECHQGGDDALMLLCDICDSPAHTYCVGLGWEVPEGNWYCDGCRPVALGSSSSQVQERVDDPRATTQSLPVRPLPVLNVPESIDLNLMSSPRTSFSQGYGHISSSRFSGRSVEAASPVSGGGAPTLSERRWIHRQIQQILSMDRMTSTPGRTNGISATNSTSNLHSSQIDQSRETNATLHARTQDVGTSYYPFLEERLCNNNSQSIQTGDPSSMRTSNARRPVVQDSIMVSSSPMNGVLWPGLVGTPSVPDNLPVHQFSTRSNIVTDVSLPPAIREQSNFQIVKEQLQSMVKSHLKSLSRDIDLGHSTFKEIARSSTHTILAACGLEHNMSEVCTVTPSPVCPHIEVMAGGQTSPIKGCCSYCFDSFVRDVVKGIFDTKMSSQWLRLGL